MNVKLTLTIEESVIEKAKKYAKGKNRSLSDIIENYLKVVAKEIPEQQDIEITPIVKSLKGSFNMPENFDYKKEMTNRLIEKYL